MIREAMFYEKHEDYLRCHLCPHSCKIKEGKSGKCLVRTNNKGILRTINYGKVTAAGLDPIEKKPLYNFHPGKNILSVGTFGCNFTCDFCQNYTIAHYERDGRFISPEDLALSCINADNNIGIAFTYNEPTIWYEYIYDTAKYLKKNYPDFKIVLVTNGFIKEGPLKELLPYIDAMNIDLKAFNNKYYKEICGGSLDPVLNTIKMASSKCHVEITSLLVNGLNDSKEEVSKIASFIGEIDKDIPLHLSRYFPRYKMDRPATNIDIMRDRQKTAKKYLNKVYLGNV
ncbi:MAG: AmmeMemoRadiSam system radical SAM enzyme [Epulopiscium sp.]|nr:AmmeMemoRadiSam system radical SAM enzyme [Candidatus Epulonipiscium sp.]